MTSMLAFKRRERMAEPSESNAFQGRRGQVEDIYGSGRVKPHVLSSIQRTVIIAGFVFREEEVPDAKDFNNDDQTDRAIARILTGFKDGS